jgi:4-hydroxybenzoate polyprenyltransferase
VLVKLRHYLSLIRFSHTVFALPFALLAAAMAWRLAYLEALIASRPLKGEIDLTAPAELSAEAAHDFIVRSLRAGMSYRNYPGFAVRWQEVVGIVLCMVFARSAAMAFNRLADRKLDAENPRTAGRHLPTGVLSVPQVAAFAAACSAAFVASTLLFLPNWLPLCLAAPALAFLLGYSYAKRFTALAHFWLGLALGLSPVAAWIAIRGEAVTQHPSDLLPALVLGGAVWAWVAGFDIIYACQDFEFDRRTHLHSVPAWLGIRDALRLAAGCHFATIGLLGLLSYVFTPLGVLYRLGVTAVAALLIYEHALVRPDDLARVNTAFFKVNAVISLGLLAVGTLDLWLS